MTPDQSSLPVPRPLNMFCSCGAPATVSVLNDLANVQGSPTNGQVLTWVPLVTPMASTPPP